MYARQGDIRGGYHSCCHRRYWVVEHCSHRGSAEPARRVFEAGRDLRGEPQLRQPIRVVGQGRQPEGERPESRGSGHYPGRPVRCPTGLLATERQQPRHDDNHCHLAGRHETPRTSVTRLLQHDSSRYGVRQPLHLERAILDQRLHRAGRQDVPAEDGIRRQRRREGRPSRLAGRVHARHRAPLLSGAVPARRRYAGPLLDRK